MPDPNELNIREADITDELEKGGPALGAFLKAIGLAVAESQKQLDAVFRDTAKMLSEQQIDVIAVFEQQIDDNGEMQKGIPKIQKLPLINYVMPVGYEFQRVYLEADMKVQEFNAKKGLNIKGKSTDLRVGAQTRASMFGASFSGQVSVGHSSYNKSIDASISTDIAAGSLHLEATIEPREDVTLPSPIIIQKGPKLAIRMTERKEITVSDDDLTVTGRQAKFEITLKKKDGSPNSSKDVDINVSDPLVSMETTSTTTDANGKLILTIKRAWGTLGDGETAPEPSEVAVRATFGVIVDSASITL